MSYLIVDPQNIFKFMMQKIDIFSSTINVLNMATTIWHFWTSNPKFWIPVTTADKAAADKAIYSTFYNYSSVFEESSIGQIIYYDQFFKHFQRVAPTGTISDADIVKHRLKAIEILDLNWQTFKGVADPILIVWSLMPLKHLNMWDRLFAALHDCGFPLNTGILSKFYQDSYLKAYNEAKVAASIISDHMSVIDRYDPHTICEYYTHGFHGLPSVFMTEEDDAAITKLQKTFSNIDRTQPLTVSLSGGVDSMVLVTVLKHEGFDVNAVHIVYGNREESQQEYAFIATFCAQLSIPLKVYKIEWLKRAEVEREFYEKVTRDLRFMTYRAVAYNNPVLLGHIKEDVVENIWTNIANVQHLHNLKKMSVVEEQLGITLLRPFLQEEKETIYRVARALSVPYLKNTTPSWSNRGKFREHFHGACIEQFGPEVDRKIIHFAETVARQSETLDRILFQPILKSWNPESNTLDIGLALDAQLDAVGWSTIFEHICHKKLGINKPSGRCIAAFGERLTAFGERLTAFGERLTACGKKGPMLMNMHGHLQVYLKDTIMKFIVI